MPGQNSDIYFGDPDQPLPDWRKARRSDRYADDDSDDDDEPSEEDRQSVIRMLGFDPRDLDDEGGPGGPDEPVARRRYARDEGETAGHRLRRRLLYCRPDKPCSACEAKAQANFAKIRHTYAAKSTPLRQTAEGKHVSAHNRSGSSACSTAASNWRLRKATHTDHVTLAQCRAAAATHHAAHLHRMAGNEAKAQHLEKVAGGINAGKPVTAKARATAAQALKAKRGAKAPETVAGKAPSVAPTSRPNRAASIPARMDATRERALAGDEKARRQMTRNAGRDTLARNTETAHAEGRPTYFAKLRAKREKAEGAKAEAPKAAPSPVAPSSDDDYKSQYLAGRARGMDKMAAFTQAHAATGGGGLSDSEKLKHLAARAQARKDTPPDASPPSAAPAKPSPSSPNAPASALAPASPSSLPAHLADFRTQAVAHAHDKAARLQAHATRTNDPDLKADAKDMGDIARHAAAIHDPAFWHAQANSGRSMDAVMHEVHGHRAKGQEAAKNAVLPFKAKAAPVAPTPKAAAAPTPTPAPAPAQSSPAASPSRHDQITARLEAAFDKHDNRGNSVKMADIRRELHDIPRHELDATINAHRRARTFSLDTHEGLHGTLTPEEKAAGIREHDSNLVWLSRNDEGRAKGGAAQAPASPARPAPAPSLKDQAAAKRSTKGPRTARVASLAEKAAARRDDAYARGNAIDDQHREMRRTAERARGKKPEKLAEVEKFVAENKPKADKLFAAYKTSADRRDALAKEARYAPRIDRGTPREEAKSRVELADAIRSGRGMSRPKVYNPRSGRSESQLSHRESQGNSNIVGIAMKDPDRFKELVRQASTRLHTHDEKLHATRTAKADARAKAYKDEQARRSQAAWDAVKAEEDAANAEDRRPSGRTPSAPASRVAGIKRAQPGFAHAHAKGVVKANAEERRDFNDERARRKGLPPVGGREYQSINDRAKRPETASLLQKIRERFHATAKAKAQVAEQAARADARHREKLSLFGGQTPAERPYEGPPKATPKPAASTSNPSSFADIRKPIHEMTADERKSQIEHIKATRQKELSTPLMSEGSISPFQVGSMSPRQKESYLKDAQSRMGLESRMRDLSQSDEAIHQGVKRKRVQAIDSQISQIASMTETFGHVGKGKSGNLRPSIQKEVDRMKAERAQLEAERAGLIPPGR